MPIRTVSWVLCVPELPRSKNSTLDQSCRYSSRVRIPSFIFSSPVSVNSFSFWVVPVEKSAGVVEPFEAGRHREHTLRHLGCHCDAVPMRGSRSGILVAAVVVIDICIERVHGGKQQCRVIQITPPFVGVVVFRTRVIVVVPRNFLA